MRHRILIISNDIKWKENISSAETLAAHHLESASSASEGWEAVEKDETDLVLLDLELPSLERLGWFKLLRRTGAGQRLPVILASARRDEDEVAQAFEHDADDYVRKDCEPEELAARVNAALRRGATRVRHDDAPIVVGGLTLDPARHLCLVRRTPVELKRREFELLEALMRRAGRVLARQFLLESIWGMSGSARTRAVDVTVGRLRRSLGPRAGRWVETVEGYGYRFRDPESFSR